MAKKQNGYKMATTKLSGSPPYGRSSTTKGQLKRASIYWTGPKETHVERKR